MKKLLDLLRFLLAPSDPPRSSSWVGRTFIFRTNSHAFGMCNGERVYVERPLTPDEADLQYVGPMFRVRFEDRSRPEYPNGWDAFADELHPLEA
jgi:hypothetical protein